MKEPPDIRRILHESAAAPDVLEWFRDHPTEREQLRYVLDYAARPQDGVRRREPEMKGAMYSEDQLPVGPLLPPPGTYTFTPATPPIHAPGGTPLAQLAQVPSSLSAFVGAAFPPFGRPPLKVPANLPPPEERIAYRMLGLVQYRGDEGEIVIETIAPSPAALRKELVLGNPAGVLPDGTPLAMISGDMLRWRSGDLLIDLYDMSSRMSREQLQDLAADVVLI